MKLAYKFRMYPKKQQEAVLDLTLETCRRLYNNSLKSRIMAWEQDRKLLTSYDQNARDLIRENSIHSQVLQDVLRRLDKSFKGFFNRSRKKEDYSRSNPRKGTVPDKFKPGYPRFKSKSRYKTFTYPQSGFKLEGSRLTLSKIGSIRIFKHRDIEGKVKTCTIKRDSTGCWYAIFVAEKEDVPRIEPKTAIGVDLGGRGYNIATTSTNAEHVFLTPYIFSEKRLAAAQSKLSRKKRGSNNWEKSRIKVAKIHKKIMSRRNYMLHMISIWITEEADAIVLEKLSIHNLAKASTIAKAQHDHAWGTLIRFVSYKAARAGKSVLFVSPKGTTKKCSRCGEKLGIRPGDRSYDCPHCGKTLDRDLNSAINILRKGIDTLGQRGCDCIGKTWYGQIYP